MAAIAWVIWNLDWPALRASLQQLQWIWVAAAGLSFLLSIGLKLLRWRWLLTGLLPELDWLTLARAYFAGYALNIVAMGRVGEVARVLLLRQEARTSGVGVATTVVAEKLLDLVFLGVAGGWWLLSLLGPPQGVDAYSLLGVSLASLLVLAGFIWFGQSLLRGLRAWLAGWHWPPGRWLAQRLESLSEGLSGLTQRRQAGRTLLLSVCIWAVMVLTNALLLPAFGLPFSGRLALSVLVLGFVGVAANLTPASIGPFHWAVSLGLTLFAVPQSTALAYAFVLHALISLLPLLLAVGLHGWRWPRPPASAPDGAG